MEDSMKDSMGEVVLRAIKENPNSIKYIEDLRDKTRVFKISINKLTGKARRQ